jgi:uncharacterized protein (DUF608 family)
MASRDFNGPYEGEHLSKLAFPLGGIGAGMICFEGTGAFSHVSIRHKPEIYNEPMMFAALWVEGHGARVLEGPVPEWKLFFPWGGTNRLSSGNGGGGKSYGLPRFDSARFTTRFPFGQVDLGKAGPVSVSLTAWSPFIPGDADASSLPVAALEISVRNRGKSRVRAAASFHAASPGPFTPAAERPASFFAAGGNTVDALPDGFVLRSAGSPERPWDAGAFAAVIPEAAARGNAAWFRGGWWDPLTLLWKQVCAGGPEAAPAPSDGPPSPGGSVAFPFTLKPGETRTVRVLLAWHVPASELRSGKGVRDDVEPPGTYVPWYAGRYASVEAVLADWRRRYGQLREASERFADCLYDTTLPPAVVEAVAANLTILRSPTVLRQADGRLWCWEGCCDTRGCCPGSCTHVWNYAQALAHLFPGLERGLRESEFFESQAADGRQEFRVALPIRPTVAERPPAADGQLGGVVKVYREWRVSGDTAWLRKMWPQVRQSLAFAVEHWDPDHTGVPVEPHHNTYDIEFWGPDGMCGTFALAALRAAALMAAAVGDDGRPWQELYEKGKRRLESELYDGEYFVQHVQWKGMRAGDPSSFATLDQTKYNSAEAMALLQAEGPKYQYGAGCLSDGVLGAWLAEICGIGEVVDRGKITSHLAAVFKHNFRADLGGHTNPQRPTYALNAEGGLLLCTWPKGGEPSLPFVYSNEVWTGIEYQAASHLMLRGRVSDGLAIVEAARRRYDGRVRNPFNEYECGHWYGRALASYALIESLAGARYDAVDRALTLEPRIAGDFRSFLATATGYGTVGVRRGKPFVEVRSGTIAVDRIDYTPAAAKPAAREARNARKGAGAAAKAGRGAAARGGTKKVVGAKGGKPAGAGVAAARAGAGKKVRAGTAAARTAAVKRRPSSKAAKRGGRAGRRA